MIIIQPVGGLCNRLRAIASAMSLATHLNQELRVSWHINSDLNASFSNFFSMNQDNLINSDDKSEPVKFDFIITDGILKEILSTGYFEVNQETSLRYFNKHLLLNRNIFISSCRKFFPYPNSIWPFFTPVTKIQDAVEGWLTQHQSQTVGIHIRRTDNTAAIQHSPLHLFVHEIEALLKKDSNTTFFLATDCSEVQEELVRLFGAAVIKTYSETKNRLTTTGLQQALVDLLLLSKTRYILGSYYSTFSLTASEIGNIQLKVLTLP